MSDLTAEEQQNVRRALKFLRTRIGGWATLAKALRCNPEALANAAGGRAGVGAGLAFRLARIASVTVDDLVAGRYPAAGTCPYCGHVPPAGSTPDAAR